MSRSYGDGTASCLARLIEAHPDCEIVLAGDIFDLTLDPAELPVEASLSAAMSPHIELVKALRSHLRGPGRVTLVPGNHDACLSDPRAFSHLRQVLAVPNEESLQIYPWFLRRGGIHVEHGHLYDPDCAPNHPLADPNPRHEGLGNALMRRFVAPNDAFVFAHKNQTTMSSGIATAFAKWGPRAPLVISRYFQTALTLWAEAAFSQGTVARAKLQGDARISAYAASQSVLDHALEELLLRAPAPTHHSARELFFRLYFDRVSAAFALVTGASLLIGTGMAMALNALPLVTTTGALTASGALLSSVGASYLIANVSQKKNRYGHAVIGQLQRAATGIIEATAAELVVLGHSHVEVDQPGYVNLGSFGFPRQGRPYLMVDASGRHAKHWHYPT